MIKVRYRNFYLESIGDSTQAFHRAASPDLYLFTLILRPDLGKYPKIRGKKDVQRGRKDSSLEGREHFGVGSCCVMENTVKNLRMNRRSWTYLLVNQFYVSYTTLNLNHPQ